MKRTIVFLVIASMLVVLMGCAASTKTKGGLIGAGSGAAAGAVIGKAAGNTILGAIIGAAVGGAAGVYIGNYMDNQAKEIENDIAGAQVERVGEGIKITFDSGLLFAVNQSTLSEKSKQELGELATILQKYNDTNILIEGHTDASGTDEYNLELSRKRAQSVSAHLATMGVSSVRFSVMGYGEAQPISSNDTAEGRTQNRRVDLAIMANDKLKKAADKNAG